MMDIPASHNFTFPAAEMMDNYHHQQQQQQAAAVSPRSLSSSGSSPHSPPLSSLSVSPQEGGLLDAPPFVERRQKNVSNFINKLYNIVNDDMRYGHLIAWGLSGTSFVITSAKLFAQNVLPEYFKHENFASFVRQLNMYGFRKANKSPRGKRGTDEDEVWEFQHPQFRRDRRDLLPEIKRKAVDSEALRREAGDMQSNFAALQAAQTQMQQQFQILQQNFSNLLRCFEELKRNQIQLQMGIQRLVQCQATGNSPQQQQQQQQQNIIQTTSTTPNSGYPRVFITTPDIHQETQSCHSIDFDAAVNTPLPPSPIPNKYYSPASFYGRPEQQQLQHPFPVVKTENFAADTYSNEIFYPFQQ